MIPRIVPKRSRWPREVFDKAQELYNARPTPTPAQLAVALGRELDDVDVPSGSALREWIEKGWITLSPDFAPWSIADSSPEDAALVLPVVKFLVQQTGKRTQRPSRVIAGWVIRIRRIRPDLPPDRVLLLAFSAQTGEDANLREVEAILAGVDEQEVDNDG